MKSLILSVKPRHCANILNVLKTIEIRKRFPKDYRGWVYIYCTKDSSNLLHKNCVDIWWVEDKDFQKKNKRLGIEQQPIYNGKVIARFYCDNVDMVYNYYLEEICELSCLTNDELLKYAGGTYDKLDDLYAINITKLEIFDIPKELSDFIKCDNNHIRIGNCFIGFGCIPRLTKAPQSWCYIETDD